MKATKIFATLFVMAAVILTFSNIDVTAADKMYKGQVVSLSKIATGGDGTVSRDEAKAMLEKGDPLCFKSGKTIYFVMSEGGSYAGKDLAKYADAKTLGVKGTAKKVKGINFIISTMIKPMD